MWRRVRVGVVTEGREKGQRFGVLLWRALSGQGRSSDPQKASIPEEGLSDRRPCDSDEEGPGLLERKHPNVLQRILQREKEVRDLLRGVARLTPSEMEQRGSGLDSSSSKKKKKIKRKKMKKLKEKMKTSGAKKRLNSDEEEDEDDDEDEDSASDGFIDDSEFCMFVDGMYEEDAPEGSKGREPHKPYCFHRVRMVNQDSVKDLETVRSMPVNSNVKKGWPFFSADKRQKKKRLLSTRGDRHQDLDSEREDTDEDSDMKDMVDILNANLSQSSSTSTGSVKKKSPGQPPAVKRQKKSDADLPADAEAMLGNLRTIVESCRDKAKSGEKGYKSTGFDKVRYMSPMLVLRERLDHGDLSNGQQKRIRNEIFQIVGIKWKSIKNAMRSSEQSASQEQTPSSSQSHSEDDSSRQTWAAGSPILSPPSPLPADGDAKQDGSVAACTPSPPVPDIPSVKKRTITSDTVGVWEKLAGPIERLRAAAGVAVKRMMDAKKLNSSGESLLPVSSKRDSSSSTAHSGPETSEEGAVPMEQDSTSNSGGKRPYPRISWTKDLLSPLQEVADVLVQIQAETGDSPGLNRRGGTSFTNELYGRLQECFSPYRVPRSKLLTKIKKFFSRKQESATSTPSDSPPPPTASASSPVLPPDPKRLSPFIMDLTADSPGSPP